MVIDEIQRDPELLLSIKSLVDELPTPGRFLLTGSARVMGLRHLPDTLVGRMETIELWPLSQGEIDQTPDHFVDVAFQLGPDLRHHSAETRDSYIERIVRGGFPAVIGRPERRRIDYLSNYVADLINRDVMELSEIERRPELRRLVTVLAGRSAQPITVDRLGSEVGLSGKTTSRYLALLEETYLIKRIPAWTRRLGARSLAQDKLAFVDSGIAAAMLGQTPARLRKPGAPLGPLLEAFVAMELARQLTWSVERAELTHYRTKDGVEVDLVLENRRGEVIGIEVKASATPSPGDFAGLRHLERRLGPDFLAGYVLHTGTDTLPAGPKMCAVPLSAIWLTQSS
jgi:predicted AAA+ superfamily ATPase